MLLVTTYLQIRTCHGVFCTCTSTCAVSYLLETWLAGAERVCTVGDTVSLISISTLSTVTATVIQLCV